MGLAVLCLSVRTFIPMHSSTALHAARAFATSVYLQRVVASPLQAFGLLPVIMSPTNKFCSLGLAWGFDVVVSVIASLRPGRSPS